MNLPQIEITTDGIDECATREYLPLCERAVTETLKAMPLGFPQNAILSILLANDMVLRSLNRQWRNIDKPTNVLSFPGSDVSIGEDAGEHLGDLAISLERVNTEAELESKRPDDHFTHLVIHGFLHLFGYDHETEIEAEVMENLEIRILAAMGIANPYEGYDKI